MSEKLGRRGLFGALAGLCAAAVGVGASETLHEATRRFLRDKSARVYGINAAREARIGRLDELCREFAMTEAQAEAMAHDIAALRSRPDTITMCHMGKVVQQSTDGGITWTEVNS